MSTKLGAIHLSLLAGFLVGRQTTVYRSLAVYLSFALVVVLVVSTVHPTDGGMKPLAYAIEYIKAQSLKSEIEYHHIYDEEEWRKPYKIIALEKYRYEMPDRAIVIHYYEDGDLPYEDRLKLVFEMRNQAWAFLNLSGRNVNASIEKTIEVVDAKKFEVFRINVDGAVFKERYYPARNGQSSYFQSLDGRWQTGKPKITVYEWSS